MSATEALPHTREEPGTVRAFIIGTVVGFIGVFLICAGMTYASGMGTAAAIGVGLYTACWGGPGFGGTMGIVLHHSRQSGH